MEPSADGGAGEENDAHDLRANTRTPMRALERGAEVHDRHGSKEEREGGSLEARAAAGARQRNDRQGKEETIDGLRRGLRGA